jgi:hypothetical protein
MRLVEVNTADAAKQFLLVNYLLQKNDPNYIRPLNKDIATVFHPQKNKAFRHGQVTRWILKDNNNELIGRIAAFVNSKYKNKGDTIAVGGMGFFECINNQDAANLLLDTARNWLQEKGMEAMDGPINFGERDRWWGLLTEGFTPPVYGLNYNPPYYRQLIENYGFTPFFNQVCFALQVKESLQEKFFSRHAAIAADQNFSATPIQLNNIEKFAADFATVYNKAWAGHGGIKQLDDKVVVNMFKAMKPVLDERICWFAYYKEEPVAIWINLPDLNQWFKYLNGQFGLWQKLYFLWVKHTRRNKKFTGLVFGVVPEFQGKGVDAYIIIEGCKVIQNLSPEGTIGKPIYDEYEMQWIGEFNPKMISVAESLGTYRSRKLVTYRYLFDRTKEHPMHPMV